MAITAPAPGFDDWEARDLTDLALWDELEPTAAELAAIEADTFADESAAQDRAFAELVARLIPAVRRPRPSRRRPGRRRPRPVGRIRRVRAEVCK